MCVCVGVGVLTCARIFLLSFVEFKVSFHVNMVKCSEKRDAGLLVLCAGCEDVKGKSLGSEMLTHLNILM